MATPRMAILIGGACLLVQLAACRPDSAAQEVRALQPKTQVPGLANEESSTSFPTGSFDDLPMAAQVPPRLDAVDEVEPTMPPRLTYHGYDCTDDCSGHSAGYRWAERREISDPDDCRGKSRSFVEGCRSWAEEQEDGEGDSVD